MSVAISPEATGSQTFKPGELTAVDANTWGQIASEAKLDSPFFRPEYFALVSEVRPDVFVTSLEDSQGVAGFLPYQRKRGSGTAVGFPLNDFQGAICRPGLAVDQHRLLSQAGLDRFEFNHWLADQSIFSEHVWGYSDSPFADLSGGFASYEQQLEGRGGKFIKRKRREARKMIREVGPLRYEHHTTCPDVFAKLVAWKRQQYARTGVVDVFAFPWVHELCDRIRFEEGAEFRGQMSALYAGDELVAVHLGLCSATVAHMWLPAYNVAYDRHSPGMILLLYFMEALAESGIQRIDFGKGKERFKESCMTGAQSVGVGMFDRNPLRRLAYKAAFQTKSFVRQQPTLAAISAWPTRFLSAQRRKSIMR